MSRCDWTADGEQCEFPGTMSEATTGGGRWLCPHHSRCDDQITGREIVSRSKRWAAMPNRADAWVESRKASVYAGESPTVKRIREQIEARRQGKPIGIVSSRIFRQPGDDEEIAA